MHCAIISALLPLSTSVNRNQGSGEGDEPAKTKISMLAAAETNAELYKRTEEICNRTTALLRLYSDLKRLGIQEERTVKTRQTFQTDKDWAHKLITAGAMKTRLQVQAMLASRSVSAQLSPSMSKDEEKYAILFGRHGEAEESSSDQHGMLWDTFTRTLTGTVRKLEKLVDYE